MITSPDATSTCSTSFSKQFKGARRLDFFLEIFRIEMAEGSFVPRITQLDAQALDAEGFQIIKNELQKAFQYFLRLIDCKFSMSIGS